MPWADRQVISSCGVLIMYFMHIYMYMYWISSMTVYFMHIDMYAYWISSMTVQDILLPLWQSLLYKQMQGLAQTLIIGTCLCVFFCTEKKRNEKRVCCSAVWNQQQQFDICCVSASLFPWQRGISLVFPRDNWLLWDRHEYTSTGLYDKRCIYLCYYVLWIFIPFPRLHTQTQNLLI